MVVRSISLAALFFAASVASASGTRLFDFDFGVLDDFEVVNPSNAWMIETIPRIWIITDDRLGGEGGVHSTFYVDGDFQISVETPREGGVPMDAGSSSWFGLVVSTTDGDYFASRISGLGREFMLNDELIDRRTRAPSVHTIRIARGGSIISGALVEDTEVFGTEQPFTTAPVRVDLWAASPSAKKFETVFDNLSITADTFFEKEPLVGDTFPLNGSVSLDDLNAVRNHFGAGELFGPPIVGDAYPFDGIVDISDLNRVLNNFGKSLPTATAVPEPRSILFPVLGFLFMTAGSTRNRQIQPGF
jgi:hypothetical protein